MSVSIPFYNAQGKELGAREVSESVFGIKAIKSILHQVVRWQRAKKRAGTHNVLTRAQASGGGRKPWKQKGTGRARAGSNTSPLWVGGGIAHGPKSRSYEFALNKKQKRQAICGALSSRVSEGTCKGIDSFALSEIKTKKAAEVLKNLGINSGEKVVVISTGDDKFVDLSLRNLEGVRNLPVEGLNVYDVINAKYVILTEKALVGVEQRLAEAV